VRRGAALASLLWLGCLSPSLDFHEMPAAPIAFVYRSVEESERIVEEAAAQQEAQTRDPTQQDQLDISLNTVAKLAGRRTQEDLWRDQAGRVGLFIAPGPRLELPDALARGARPVDWSADHTRLLFSLRLRETSHLYEWNAATGDVRQLTSGSASEVDGCYLPEGALAWVQWEPTGPRQGTRLWLRRPGEMPRQLTEGTADTQPTCAPDGSRVVFTRIDPKEGATLRWLDPRSEAEGSYGRGRSADFSPDGEFIIYSGPTAKGWQLRRMRFDGSGKRSFGASGFLENDPAISPDARYVVFSAKKTVQTPISSLFVRSIDGEHDRQLEFSGSGLLPVW
jgi:Tol biopolymer transport system component